MFQQNGTPAKDSYDIVSTVNVTYDKDHCLIFWYYEDGEDPFNLNVYMQAPINYVIAYRYRSAIENRLRWNLLKVDIQFNPGYKATCKCC